MTLSRYCYPIWCNVRQQIMCCGAARPGMCTLKSCRDIAAPEPLNAESKCACPRKKLMIEPVKTWEYTSPLSLIGDVVDQSIKR